MDPLKVMCIIAIGFVIIVGLVHCFPATRIPVKICFEGISYIQFDHAVIVQVDSYGLPVICK